LTDTKGERVGGGKASSAQFGKTNYVKTSLGKRKGEGVIFAANTRKKGATPKQKN